VAHIHILFGKFLLPSKELLLMHATRGPQIWRIWSTA